MPLTLIVLAQAGLVLLLQQSAMQAQNQFLDQSLLMAVAEEDRLLLVPLLAAMAVQLHLQVLNLAAGQAIAVVLVAALRLL